VQISSVNVTYVPPNSPTASGSTGSGQTNWMPPCRGTPPQESGCPGSGGGVNQGILQILMQVMQAILALLPRLLGGQSAARGSAGGQNSSSSA
jgi:hypothetical protein